MAPRGIRNNNPGNLKHGNDWQGLSEKQADPAFAQFDEPVMGLRALYRVLSTYQTKHNKHTVREIINRWAPPSICSFCKGTGKEDGKGPGICPMCRGTKIENQTSEYVKAVALALGVSPNQPIDVVNDFDVAVRLMRAIVLHENGTAPYSDLQYRTAISRAIGN